jgi:hypothetical protein
LANLSHTAALVTNTVTTFTLTGQGPYLVVTNFDATVVVWARADGVDPAVAGDDCIPVLPGREVWFKPKPTSTTVAVKVIATGTPTVCVRQERRYAPYHLAG